MSEQKRTGMNPAALRALLAGDEKNFAVASMPGGIEAQEALAQQDLIESQKLPKEGTIKAGYGHAETNQAQLEAIGFVFGQEIDNLFIACQFPKDWSIEPTDHSMWSYVKDEQGRKRIAVFYKGAFYDRHAHASMERRFHVLNHYAASPDLPEERINFSTDAYKTMPVCYVVRDHDGSVVFHSAPYGYSDRQAEQAARDACDEWLQEHYPDYRNPFAYW